jgi:hypothetical protein
MSEAEIGAAIRRYWAARGYAVDASPRDVAVKGRSGVTVHYIVVRSNLIGGLPPGYQDMTPNSIAVAG